MRYLTYGNHAYNFIGRKSAQGLKIQNVDLERGFDQYRFLKGYSEDNSFRSLLYKYHHSPDVSTTFPILVEHWSKRPLSQSVFGKLERFVDHHATKGGAQGDLTELTGLDKVEVQGVLDRAIAPVKTKRFPELEQILNW